MPDQLHATERPADEQAPVIERLLDEMEKRGFMPIIFKHLTRAFIVDNATTYAYVMADGLVRLGRLMSHDPTPPRELRVLAASRVAPDAYGVQTPMTRDDDVPRIEERLGIERARANAHRRELEWTWTIRFGSGKKRPDLWIADALSNAWRRLKTFPSDTRQRLRAFFAPHEKQLSPNRENEVGWTRAKTITLALTSANHRGAVSVADAHLTRLRPMRPALARQFEHLPLLLDGQFGQAVHQSNTDHITLRSLALGARADRLALRAEDRGKAYDAEVSDVERCWSRLVDPVMPKSQRDWFGTWKSRIDEAKAEKSTEHVQALWSMLAWDVPY